MLEPVAAPIEFKQAMAFAPGEQHRTVHGVVLADDLIKELVDRAGLSEEQAKAAAEVVVEWVKDEEKRKKILIAAVGEARGL
jgi:hypothetical protein